MSKTLVIKRDGRVDTFDEAKITSAIMKAVEKVGGNDVTIAEGIKDKVVEQLRKRGNKHHVEDIQDLIEKTLIENGHAKTAKEFILYRSGRTRVREMNSSLMKTFEELTLYDDSEVDIRKENANIDGDSSMGTMLRYGSEAAKKFNLLYLISEDIANAHKMGDIHIHDLDFYSLTETCCQIDLEKLFTGGFNTGHGFLREPGEIRSYAALTAIAIQSNQNDMHGGQSIPCFDYYMEPGVAKTFIKQIRKVVRIRYPSINSKELYAELKAYRDKNRTIMNDAGYKFVKAQLSKYISEKEADSVIKTAAELSEEETYQAMEALIHNLNSMHSRAGAQIPFSSINYGTCTSTEGRMVMRCLLRTTEEGLGNGETAIFPVQIFKMKKGVNIEEGEPNYDLFKYACKVSASRHFPNFSNLDAPYNRAYLKAGNIDTEVAYMGCRTRVIGNVHDKSREIVTGRGNLSFTSINLPRIALETNTMGEFFCLLHERLELVARQLYDRYLVQCRKHPKNFPFLMGQGLWLDSEELEPDGDISEILKHGTLSIGFIGLAETLIKLTGKHHGESESSQKLGLEIIKYMRDFCDKKTSEVKMNYTLLATPAEGLAGRLIKIDKQRYGEIPGITDKEYYTNSFHVPVYYKISAFEKIRIEAPYHELTNAGHITYIEMDGDPSKNLEAFERIVKYMHKKNIGYGAINHVDDRDPICGYRGIINDVCPRCGRKEGEPMTMEMWRKVKGYAAAGNLDTQGTCGNPYEEADRVPNIID